MERYTYLLRFTHSDSPEIEEFEHSTEAGAREHFELFGPDDADIYSRIDLLEFDWQTRTERRLDSLHLPA